MFAPTYKFLLSKLGTCRKCMRQSFLAAATAWILALAALPLSGRWPSLLIAAAAAMLTMLWLAHIYSHAYRRTKATAGARQIAEHRRSFMLDLGKAFVGAAIATSVPAGASRAQAYFGCDVCYTCQDTGQICCCPPGYPYLSQCDCRCYASSPDCPSFTRCFNSGC